LRWSARSATLGGVRTIAAALLVLGLSLPAGAQRDEGAFCRIITRGPPPTLTRALLREMVADAESSLGGCIAYDDLRSATLVIRVETDRSVTVTARTRPSRDELAEDCLAGNARDRIVRSIEPFDVSRAVSTRLRVDRDD
jgi:hypothetical protein